MRLEELLNVMDETEEIDLWVDKTAKIDVATTKELFDRTRVDGVKNSVEYNMIQNFPVWFIGRTCGDTIEIRVCILKKDKSE